MKIINNLRDESSPVNAVCGRKNVSFVRKLTGHSFVGKYSLDGALRVVEISLYSDNRDVISFLRTHLQFLHFAYALFGIKHRNARAVDVPESFESRFTGISARRNENKYFFIESDFFCRRGQKMRKKGKRDVLESERRTVKQFEDKRTLVGFNYGAYFVRIET